MKHSIEHCRRIAAEAVEKHRGDGLAHPMLELADHATGLEGENAMLRAQIEDLTAPDPDAPDADPDAPEGGLDDATKGQITSQGVGVGRDRGKSQDPDS